MAEEEEQTPEPVQRHMPHFPCMCDPDVCYDKQLLDLNIVSANKFNVPQLEEEIFIPQQTMNNDMQVPQSCFQQPQSTPVGFIRSEEKRETLNFSFFLRSPALRKSNQIPSSGATIPTGDHGLQGKPGSGPTRSNPPQKEWVPVPVPDEQSEAVGYNDKASNTRFPSSSRVHHGSKRKRKPGVHSLSEKRRREKINKKMRALQELIPNCTKVDKVSVLDDAIEYLKNLQLQVQMMSMGSSGVYMPPMMLPAPSMQHIHARVPLGGYSPMAVAMQMGLGCASLMPGINLTRLNMLGLPGQVLLTSMSPSHSPFVSLAARFPQIPVPTPAASPGRDRRA
ncbi:hypothetical protein HRI_004595300 [Hibiscus trionum]|uniref:BHLH domain-containing protein n=1 Tax=Hibiscus trionum TaxID=183268 RepID=A0A9W7J611_HIBTR|nr:hypothetical protein HRI_004595300 [Hibiscus trionum]